MGTSATPSVGAPIDQGGSGADAAPLVPTIFDHIMTTGAGSGA